VRLIPLLIVLTWILELTANRADAESILLKHESGVLVLPVQVNNAITLKFTIDSGASDVVIPLDVFSTLSRAGTITQKDMLDSQTYELADGSQQKARRFRIRSLKMGNLELHDVVGSVAPTGGTLLLGQSFLSRLPSWSIDNQHDLLVVGEATNAGRSGSDNANSPTSLTQGSTRIGADQAATPPTHQFTVRDSPAQAGYCEEFLRLNLASEQKPTEYAPTPQMETMQRDLTARLRLTMEQWRQSIRSLLATAPLDGSVELEILRGKTQARSDDKYTEAKSMAPGGDADFLACQSAPDVVACLESKTKQDPMFEGMRQRAAPCARGPGL
jgi:clan AA aspartic protease (TIGR02281 family)